MYGFVGRRIFMAATKKTTAAKEETAKVADTKTDEVKTAKEAPAAKTETVTTATKKPGRKPAAEKKAPAKKETVRKETAAEKTEVRESLHIQFNGKSYASEELVRIAKDVWVFDLNQEEKDFKSVELYVKPEENVVYYVINGSVQGSFNI